MLFAAKHRYHQTSILKLFSASMSASFCVYLGTLCYTLPIQILN